MPPAGPRLSFAGGTLVLEGMPRGSAPAVFHSIPWVWDRRVSAWRCDAVEYVTARDGLRSCGCRFEDEVPDWQPVSWPRVEIHRLRPEQEAAAAAWTRTERACIAGPTGAGKTAVA